MKYDARLDKDGTSRSSKDSIHNKISELEKLIKEKEQVDLN